MFQEKLKFMLEKRLEEFGKIFMVKTRAGLGESFTRVLEI